MRQVITILSTILFSILACVIGFFRGKKAQRLEQNNEVLNEVREFKKTQDKLDSVSVADKRKWLQQYHD